jgi:peptidoglycan/LPS O-acetylase OafA/YrhL
MPFFIAGELVRHISWLNWQWHDWQYGYLGNPVQSIRLTTVFLVGGCFFLFKDNIRFTRPLAWCNVCAILAVRLFEPEYIEVAFVVFGGYLLFYFGNRPMASLSWMANVPDLSYGIYLYGWPVESYLIWRFHWSPWIVFAESTVICACLAWLSWTFIEGPALSLKGKTTPSPRRQELKVALATG